MKRKGFIISVDGMLALAVTLVLFISAAFYLAQVRSEAVSTISLREFSTDLATVLEKSEIFENAVDTGSVSEIRSLVNKMPDAICLEVKIYGSDDLDVADSIVLREGCTAIYEEKTSAKRSFFVGGSNPSLYLGEVSAWYKVSG